MNMHVKSIIIVMASVFVCLLHACKTKHGQMEDALSSPDHYEEGDTLRVDAALAPGLLSWIEYHRMSDTGLRMSAMPASGVIIHLDPMDTLGMTWKNYPDTLMAWSPDRSRFIDIWSYNHVMDTMRDGRLRITGGGPEQIVALNDLRRGQRHVLMFNGTGQYAESADWLDDQSFVICLMLVDETTGERTPDIMLFNLNDSLFTDFRYVRAIPGDSQPPTPGGFMRQWVQRRGLQTE
jgi:hypothetical protein